MRGPLASVSQELDDAFYGTAARNRADHLEWTVRVLFAGLRTMGLCAYGAATPTPAEDEATLARGPRRPENTYHWINKLHEVGAFEAAPEVELRPGWTAAHDLLEATEGFGAVDFRIGHMHEWQGYVAWRVDIALGLSELAPTRWRVFTHYMDGLNRSQIAEQMGDGEEEAWSDEAVRSVIKECSRVIRKRAEMRWPAKGEPRHAGQTTTGDVLKLERAIAGYRMTAKERRRRARLRVLEGGLAPARKAA